MNDRAVNLLEQYDVEILKTRKGRGAFLCDTPDGCLIFKEYSGNEERLQVQDRLLKHLQSVQNIRAEVILPNKEGELYVKDYDDVKYVLKTYAEGRECNINDRKECLEAVKLLARLHTGMEFSEEEALGLSVEDTTLEAAHNASKPSSGCCYRPSLEYEKRNRELKRVRSYLKKRSQKTWFEIFLQQNFDLFLEQACSLEEEWKSYEKLRDAKLANARFQDAKLANERPQDERLRDEQAAVQSAAQGQDLAQEKKVTFCHGDYQYHNILKTENDWFVINFEKCIIDDPVRDLYLLMRKLLEKSNWSIPLGRELLAAYEETRPLPALSRIDLYYRLAYPEKFRKIVNFYYNSGKAWIPGKNLEKLERVVEQEPGKQEFLDVVFRKNFTSGL